MSTEVWSYHPTEGVTETTQAALRGDAWGPRAALYSTTTSRQLKRFELSWGPAVSSAECNSMLAFFRARNGSFDSFQWVSPIDGLTHQVRFDSTLRADHFDPGWFRAGGQLAFTETHTPTLTTIVGSLHAIELSLNVDPGSGGIQPDASSGDGAGRQAFWWPDAWYIAGWDKADLSGTTTIDAPAANLVLLQPFAMATSGVAIDKLGIVVGSGLAGQYVVFGLYAANGPDGAGLFDAYPGSRVALSSAHVDAIGIAVASIGRTALADTAYWIAYVTSYNTPAAQFHKQSWMHADVTGQNSAADLAIPFAFTYQHSLALPSTFPSSATASGVRPYRVVFHVVSEVP